MNPLLMLRVLLPLLAVSGCSFATAAECEFDPTHAASRPPAPGPTPITVGAVLVDLNRINDVEQTASVDLFASLSWTDGRLRGRTGCGATAADIWIPDIRMVNSGPGQLKGAPRISIAEDGKVAVTVRWFGELSSPHHLSAFPFDQRTIRIRFVVPGVTADEVDFVVDRERVYRLPELSVVDWSIGELTAGAVTQSFGLSGELAGLELSLTATRNSQFFVYKLIIPLMMIVAMSWAVFWVDPKQAAPRLGVATTSMLTLIAFQFAQSAVMPRIGYFTVMDRFVSFSSILVFMALALAVATSYLARNERFETINTWDRFCRWSFPLAFAAASTVILLSY